MITHEQLKISLPNWGLTGLLGDIFVVGGRGVEHKLELAAVQIIHDLFSAARNRSPRFPELCLRHWLGRAFASGGSIPLGDFFLFGTVSAAQSKWYVQGNGHGD
jgi:hypothetical protein